MARLDDVTWKTSMSEPEFRKPIFGFLWSRDQVTPVDQLRFIRIKPRGLLRISILALSTLLLLALTSITFVYLSATRNFLEAITFSVMAATLWVVVLRGWTLGTYVNDHGLKVITLLTTRRISWEFVQDVRINKRMWTVAGIPLGIRTVGITVDTADGRSLDTHVFVGSIDGPYRTDSLPETNSLIRRWWMAK